MSMRFANLMKSEAFIEPLRWCIGSENSQLQWHLSGSRIRLEPFQKLSPDAPALKFFRNRNVLHIDSIMLILDLDVSANAAVNVDDGGG